MNEELDGVEKTSGPSGVAKRQISRRTVALGTAWSVPVILTAVAAPASAASVPPPPAPPVIGATLTGDKVAADQFGVKHVNFTLTLTNTGAGPGTVQVLSVVSDKTAGTQQGLPATVVIPPGGSKDVAFAFGFTTSAATATYTVSYEWSGTPHTAVIKI